MKDYINKLLKERLDHQQRIKHIDDAIESIQRLCPHHYEKIGQDHNYKYFACSECGHTKEV